MVQGFPAGAGEEDVVAGHGENVFNQGPKHIVVFENQKATMDGRTWVAVGRNVLV